MNILKIIKLMMGLSSRISALEESLLKIDARTRCMTGWNDDLAGHQCEKCTNWVFDEAGNSSRCVCKTATCAGFRKRS